ncbi:MAG: complex I NDUFA9 subunit family protein [Bacillaceae bacterium]|nr:complex I NDUFA9 subunit family protein [Bacillaceae bacterium]
MNIFITGGTGFVGRAMVRYLLGKGHHLRCLVRPGSRHKLDIPDYTQSRVAIVEGDLHDPQKLAEGIQDADAVIHLVGIIREFPRKGITFDKIHIEGTRHMVNAARENGIKRFVHMSALGARPNATSAYHRSKYEAEQIVMQSGIPHVIFQPSVIYGPDDEFINMLAGLARLPVTPVIGDGEYKLQPVALETVCRVFEQALEHPQSPSSLYEVGGPDVLSYNDMLDKIGEVIHTRVRKLHQPLWLMKPMIQALEGFAFFPITSNQLTMLLEGNVCRDGERLYQDFEIDPIPFVQGIKRFLP